MKLDLEVDFGYPEIIYQVRSRPEAVPLVGADGRVSKFTISGLSENLLLRKSYSVKPIL